ncbi:hypothetical protein PsorP6_005315 [Peronosclerospora sorghi]|uniref:Uncharacterized protein n=1 Tax=Peronosclerospora sorghi TaxID=230839 RepID=A0ACC0W3N0_9STRA|nr:hypothetical protein PsorP6_005315 [Peronosclerospora sorghi]
MHKSLLKRQMDLNSASARDLQRLPGVGSVIARLVIASRPFSTLEDLRGVKGIGPAKFAAIQAQNLVYVDENAGKCSVNRSKIDLNVASSVELKQLRGVGPVLAQRIIEARPFYRKEDLLAVNGIGATSYGKLQSSVHVGLADSSQQQGNDNANDMWDETPFHPKQDFDDCREVAHGVRGSVFSRRRHEESNRALLVASWNIRNLSRKKDIVLLQRIAEVLGEFDLVALQEVRDLIVLKRLKTMLPGWDYVASDPVGRTSPETKKRTERYAFFFRRCMVRLVGKLSLMEDKKNVLGRLPCVATFQATNESSVADLELTLMNIHVSFGEKERRDNEIMEINHLANELNASASSQRKVMVLGDFNLSPQDILGRTGSHRMALIRAPLSTTVFGKLYDNIWLERNDFRSSMDLNQQHQLRVASGVLRIDWRYYPSSKSNRLSMPHAMDPILPRLQRYISRVQCGYELSDHCPVWVAFAAASVLSEGE